MIDEDADAERARRARRRRHGLRERAGELGAEAREALRRQGQGALARFVDGASDAQLERRLGNRLAQRAIFTGMARQFEPRFAFGFEGDIVYELVHRADGAKPPGRWTLRVADGHARAIPGESESPAVRLRFRIADFARLAAERIEVGELLFEEGRLEIEGDLHVAARLTEMFGGRSQF